MAQPEIVFVNGARTPFGRFGGSLRQLSATDLAVVATKAALERAGVSPDQIDHVIFGNALQTSKDAIYLARHVGLRAGIPQHVPAVTVNRLCGSGFQSLVYGAQEILLGRAQCVLAGGTESMSQAPHCLWGARWGLRLGQGGLEDLLWAALTDTFSGYSMALTAENLADRFDISREAADEYAERSQRLTREAYEAGRLQEELVPVELPGETPDRLDRDEHSRPETSLEGLAKLPPYFKEGGTVTAGNASGIVDGAAAMVLASAEWAEQHSLNSLGRLVDWGVAGCDPDIMGIGPVPASRQALERTGLPLNQIDLIEVNEAFAPQYLAVEKELGLERERVNVNGGAIAIGHPLAATGTRLVHTLLLELRRRQAKRGLATACIGGGQGMAVIIEAL